MRCEVVYVGMSMDPIQDWSDMFLITVDKRAHREYRAIKVESKESSIIRYS